MNLPQEIQIQSSQLLHQASSESRQPVTSHSFTTSPHSGTGGPNCRLRGRIPKVAQVGGLAPTPAFQPHVGLNSGTTDWLDQSPKPQQQKNKKKQKKKQKQKIWMEEDGWLCYAAGYLTYRATKELLIIPAPMRSSEMGLIPAQSSTTKTKLHQKPTFLIRPNWDYYPTKTIVQERGERKLFVDLSVPA